ncbi:MAG: alanine dehydrogenase [Candidatus Bathyarchaeota archaeon]|nr:alanine dehydrogenase [Candidatus Bathyarchaeota archaeon]
MEKRISLISEDDVKNTLTMDDALQAVEDALCEKGSNRVQMPPKTYIFFKKYEGDFRTMPSYLECPDIAGVKVVNVHPNNPKTYHTPSIMATILLIDPKTGAIFAILGGTTITAMRTGAISGLATKYLARKESTTLAIVGAGTQARTQLSAISKILNLRTVRVYDKNDEAMKRFIEEAEERYSFTTTPATSLEDCVTDADVISTTTPVTTPIIQDAWISPGTHINAIGADAPGKEELDPEILKRATIVVDDLEQAAHSGEINVPLTMGAITMKDIHGELCEIVVGKKTGRTSKEEITVFDSTGLSVLDVATAWMVYKRTQEKKLGSSIFL